MQLNPPPGAKRGDADDAWYAVVRMYHHIAHQVDLQLQRRHDLTMSTFEVLLRLAGQTEPVPIKDLAAAVLISRSRLSRVLGELAERGLLTRDGGVDDRRMTVVELTDLGRSTYLEASATHERVVTDLMLSRLDDKQIAVIAAAGDTVAPESTPPSG